MTTNFKLRTIFGGLLIFSALAVILSTHLFYLWLTSFFLALVLSYEYHTLLELREIHFPSSLLYIQTIFIFGALIFGLSWLVFFCIFFSLLGFWGIVYGVALLLNKKKGQIWGRFFATQMLWILLPTLLFVCIQQLPHGHALLLFLMMTIGLTDIFAYFGGKIWGKKKLMPSISPGKTIEGSLCGLLASLVGGFLFHFFSPIFSVISIFFLSLFTSVISQVGDLTESYFKRLAKVKDSSQLIPGHGGFLDRFDGFLLATSFFFGLLVLFYSVSWPEIFHSLLKNYKTQGFFPIDFFR